MKPEKQRIAIAEACGWVRDDISDCWRKDGLPAFIEDPHHLRQLPDYLNDLNAMNEAVMSLSTERRKMFRRELQYMIAPRTIPGPACSIVLMSMDDYDKWFHATSAQRAEAFIRTIGKWEDNA